jgi:hypothetical protein
MKSSKFLKKYVSAMSIGSALLPMALFAQRSQWVQAEDGESNLFIYAIVIIALVGVGLIFWWRKRGIDADNFGFDGRMQGKGSVRYDDPVDVTEEMEWFRKAKQAASNSRLTRNIDVISNGKTRSKDAGSQSSNGAGGHGGSSSESKEFKEKMMRAQYAALPINSFLKLTEARTYTPLPLSSDPGLLSAIEQANDEFEEDEAVRELAVRVLAAFRNRNSVDALSQLALYDLSANVRSRAVVTLTEFDHESVFETILLACADPTREVRAAAARGLIRLTFDRAEAWKRIADSGDEFRKRHAARAAVESGIAQKSFDRLLHEDMRIAYEAVALFTLLIRSDEFEIFFDNLLSGKSTNLKLAILHVIKLVNDEKCLARLAEIYAASKIPADIAVNVTEIVAGRSAVSV